MEKDTLFSLESNLNKIREDYEKFKRDTDKLLLKFDTECDNFRKDLSVDLEIDKLKEFESLIKKMHEFQSGSIKKFEKIFVSFNGKKEYNKLTTIHNRNFILYYLHSNSEVRKRIHIFLNLIKEDI
ncbi:MAG: hypothetical protein V1775_00400 [Bacteroidota bacterium]